MIEKTKHVVTVSLLPTMFDTQRRADVELPMTCYSAALTPLMIVLPLAFWCFTGIGLFVMAGNHHDWATKVFTYLTAVLACATTAQLFTRAMIGNQRVTIAEDGIEDTRYGSAVMPWTAVRSATLVNPKGLIIGILLKFREPQIMSRPLIGHLASNGLPSWSRKRILVELSSVDRSDVVASTITYLLDQVRSRRSW